MTCALYTRIVHEYVRCMNARDWRGIAALYATDATLEDPVGTDPIRGIDAVTAFYRSHAHRPMHLELLGQIRVAGQEAAFPFIACLDWEGRATQIHVIDVFRFDAQAKVSSMRAFFGAANFVVAAEAARPQVDTYMPLPAPRRVR
jgi:steroid delta-isomerase